MRRALAILAAALILAASANARAPEVGGDIAIVGATVLPMTGTERLSNQTVLVRGDRIVAVGPRGRVKVPAGARTVDARGKVLMPGLVDMHIHLAPVPGEPGDAAQRALAVMLAHGVSTARGMAGSPANLEVRARIEAGELAGPRLYAAAPALNDAKVPSAEAAREAVRAAKGAGYDLIKSHHLSDPSIWQAVQDEARAQKLPVAGHVAGQVGLDRAMSAGQQIEHLDGVIAALLPKDSPEAATEFGQIPPPPVMAMAGRASDAELSTFAQKAAAAKSWHVPTLGLFEKIVDLETSAAALIASPDMRYVPDAALKQWAGQSQQLRASGMTPEYASSFRETISAHFPTAGRRSAGGRISGRWKRARAPTSSCSMETRRRRCRHCAVQPW